MPNNNIPVNPLLQIFSVEVRRREDFDEYTYLGDVPVDGRIPLGVFLYDKLWFNGRDLSGWGYMGPVTGCCIHDNKIQFSTKGEDPLTKWVVSRRGTKMQAES
jgi:hypothetical protein